MATFKEKLERLPPMKQAGIKAEPWKCSHCAAVVFIPDDGKIKGGVCTQQRRGCRGEISKMDAEEAARVRGVLAERRLVEQPWLTLVFKNRGVA